MSFNTNRRTHLTFWFKSFQVVWVIPLLQACNLFRNKEKIIGTIDDLKHDKYIVTDFNGDDIFVGLDEKEQPYALSLICTHKQCTVEFKFDENQFVCPCHKGRYTKLGKVISGKPKRDLDRLSVINLDGKIVVRDDR